MDLFSSLAYHWLGRLCIAMVTVVNSNSGSGAGGERMGPSYQGAAESPRSIKFSAATLLSGVQVDVVRARRHS